MRTVFVFVLIMFSTIVSAAPPSEASIRELLEISQSAKIVDASMAQADTMMSQMMQQALQGKEVKPEVQEVISRAQTRMVGLLKEEMSWAKMEPMFINIYQKSFSQYEVDGMIEFYKSDVGQALITKMPVVMQHTMSAMQDVMMDMMPKMQEIQADMIAEIKALH